MIPRIHSRATWIVSSVYLIRRHSGMGFRWRSSLLAPSSFLLGQSSGIQVGVSITCADRVFSDIYDAASRVKNTLLLVLRMTGVCACSFPRGVVSSGRLTALMLSLVLCDFMLAAVFPEGFTFRSVYDNKRRNPQLSMPNVGNEGDLVASILSQRTCFPTALDCTDCDGVRSLLR